MRTRAKSRGEQVNYVLLIESTCNLDDLIHTSITNCNVQINYRLISMIFYIRCPLRGRSVADYISHYIRVINPYLTDRFVGIYTLYSIPNSICECYIEKVISKKKKKLKEICTNV